MSVTPGSQPEHEDVAITGRELASEGSGAGHENAVGRMSPRGSGEARTLNRDLRAEGQHLRSLRGLTGAGA
jgi:hypothetical protein